MMALYDDGYRTGEASLKLNYDDEPQQVIALPHQCDEWSIGTADRARQLIADLEDLITEMEKPPEETD